jgi:hypothetical protein
MHVEFTEQEKKYIVKEPFNWHTKDGAPDDVRDSINQKINAMNNQGFKPNGVKHAKDR